VIAAAVLAIVVLLRREQVLTARNLASGAIIALIVGTVMALETAGVSVTSATNAGLIISLAIIFTPLFDSLFKRSWLPGGYFLCSAAAVVGVALLVTQGGAYLPRAGDLVILAAAIVRGFGTTVISRLTRSQSSSPLSLTFVQLAVMGVVFTLADLSGVRDAVATIGWTDWAALVYLAVACSVFAFLAQTWAIKKTSASRASLLLGSEPVWAVLVGVAIGGEALGPLGFVGAAVIIAATYVGQGIEARHRARLDGAAGRVAPMPRPILTG
jgi:drug/metabolite transporter (DMT)-like permease